jgi:large subunit ribosomal protein L25
MKKFELKGALRSQITKQDVKALRAQSLVPCVLYGGDEQVHFSVAEFDLRGLVYTPEAHMVNLNLDGGKSYKAILQDIQFHPVTDAINHIDFLQVFDDRPLTMGVPVKFTGASEGVKMGGKLVAKGRKLKVNGLPNTLPDFISIDISSLRIGDGIRIRDLNVPGVTFLDSPNNMIVSVRMTRNVTAEAAEAAKK